MVRMVKSCFCRCLFDTETILSWSLRVLSNFFRYSSNKTPHEAAVKKNLIIIYRVHDIIFAHFSKRLLNSLHYHILENLARFYGATRFKVFDFGLRLSRETKAAASNIWKRLCPIDICLRRWLGWKPKIETN